MAFSSRKYWNRRYKKNRGATLAPRDPQSVELASQKITNFITQNKILSVLDYGCGDCFFLDHIRVPHYHGVDISDFVINKMKKKYELDAAKDFFWNRDMPKKKYDLVLSLDVFDNLVEQSLFEEYVSNLCFCTNKYLFITGSNKDSEGNSSTHVRTRSFSKVLEERDFEVVNQTKLPNGSILYLYEKISQTEKEKRARKSRNIKKLTRRSNLASQTSYRSVRGKNTSTRKSKK